LIDISAFFLASDRKNAYTGNKGGGIMKQIKEVGVLTGKSLTFEVTRNIMTTMKLIRWFINGFSKKPKTQEEATSWVFYSLF
jgi:hypothetical protein